MKWRWTDVVGTEPGKIDPVDAFRIRELLNREVLDDHYEDTWFEVPWELAEYVEKKYDVEVGESDPQTRLDTGTPGRPAASRVQTDGSRRDDDSCGVQVTLTGNVASTTSRLTTADRVNKSQAGAAASESRTDRVEDDAGQVGLAVAYAASRVTVGRLTRPTGQVYG